MRSTVPGAIRLLRAATEQRYNVALFPNLVGESGSVTCSRPNSGVSASTLATAATTVLASLVPDESHGLPLDLRKGADDPASGPHR